MALFILCGKNQVCILFDASTNISLDNSDKGIYEKQAIIEVNRIMDQKSIFPFPFGAGIASGTAQVYMVPNSGGSAGTASTSNQIFDVDVYAGETVLIEPSYPIVIESTGDTVQVGTGSTTINFLLTGDKEA